MCPCIAWDFSASSWHTVCCSTPQEKLVWHVFQHEFCKLLLKGKPGTWHPKYLFICFDSKERRKASSTMFKLLPVSYTSFIQSFKPNRGFTPRAWVDHPQPSGRNTWESTSNQKPGAYGPSVHACRHDCTQDLRSSPPHRARTRLERAALCPSHVLLVLSCFFWAHPLGWGEWE